MTTYYVDTTAGGGGDGAAWGTAWNNLQSAIDKPLAAGDVVLCYSNGETNKESPAATIDFDGTSGDTTSGYIKFIGCSANSGDGSPDGTKYVLDGGGARDPIAAMNCDYIWIENFRFTNASGDGVDSTNAPDYWVWVNCEFDNNGDDGYSCETYLAQYHTFVCCRFHSNTGNGAYGGRYGQYINCAFYQNGENGIYVLWHTNRYLRCAFFDNGDSQINCMENSNTLIDSCIFDGTNQSSETGLDIRSDNTTVLASRFTNCDTGLDGDSDVAIVGWCLFHNNTDDTFADTLMYHLPFESDLDLSGTDKGVFSEGNPAGTTNKFSPDADDGYNAASSKDYNLKAGRTYNGESTDVVDLGVG
jgi:hypothetical protein